MNILILGANGFIGSHLCEHLLKNTEWTIQGFDIKDFNLGNCLGKDNFSFRKGDFYADDEWIEEAVNSCDAVLPLVGIAKPAFYITNPVMTFHLDFEANLKIVRMCVKHGKRVIFPSTSEVYGMSTDKELKEDESPIILGPVCKSRWIYSCSKQMMDRVIAAYGQEEGLRYTLFRPFNWIGSRLDTFTDARDHKARSITQILYDILNDREISLVGGGRQRRSFTWIGDGVKCLEAIIRNDNKCADGEIFNIGNPANNASIKELALMIIRVLKEFPQHAEKAERAQLREIDSRDYYGKGYEDVQDRVPSVAKAKLLLGWEPETMFEEAVKKTLEATLRENDLQVVS
ncbi:MAG TPA: bifunctional UDP-4-keto-pentose/UDP-xylose synthase [Synergistales bacterium]|nr:bifunctional UDP-4-keto-pentose/UDP-xylose synthase [Synergistales bacterium]HRV71544.1 bifunctional UDP-4-keto-pentose/UDP-xylose synthase [Thermovirgaceae bacterium]